MSFWTKFTQKGYYQLKTEETVQKKIGYVLPPGLFYCIKFFKSLIKFRSKFQFQILLQFDRTVEKVETCDGNLQKF